MSAEIIQFVPRPNDRRKKLDDMAIEIMNQCFPSVYPGIQPLRHVAQRIRGARQGLGLNFNLEIAGISVTAAWS